MGRVWRLLRRRNGGEDEEYDNYYGEYEDEWGEHETYYGDEEEDDDEEVYYECIYTIDAEECDSAADEEECSVYLQRRKAHRAKLRSKDPYRKFPRSRRKGRFPRFRRGRGKGRPKGKGKYRRGKGGGKGKGPHMGRPMFGRQPRFGHRRRFYLADHEFPSDIAEALDEIYFKKTGRRRKGGKGKGSSSSFDDMMKGSKGSKGKGFGKGFQRFGGFGKGKSGG